MSAALPSWQPTEAAARAGEWSEALDVLLAGLIKSNAPVSTAERDELASLFEATGLPSGAVAALSVSQS